MRQRPGTFKGTKSSAEGKVCSKTDSSAFVNQFYGMFDWFWGYYLTKYAKQGILSPISDRFKGIVQEAHLN